VNGRSWRTSTAIRTGWLFATCPLVCVAVGSVVGAAMFGAAGVARGAGADAIRAVPLLVVYSLPITVPFGTISGVLAAFVISVLGLSSLRGASFRRWLRAGVASGGAVGAVCPAFLALGGFGAAGLTGAAFSVVAGAVAGMVSGAIVSWLGWREFGSQAQATVRVGQRSARAAQQGDEADEARGGTRMAN